MQQQSDRNEPILPRYAARTPEDYLNAAAPDAIASFSPTQIQIIKSLLEAAIPKPAPKIVDLRFGINLLFSRFYVVLFVGKDRRGKQRQYSSGRASRWSNAIAAILLLISINLVISLFILMFAYLVKSAVGIDLTPGHLSDQVDRF